MVAIEYSELRVTDEMPRMRQELESFGMTLPPILKGETLVKYLIKAINKRKKKEQFTDYPNAERILLFKDWVSGFHRVSEFLECNSYFQKPDNPGCDHCYII